MNKTIHAHFNGSKPTCGEQATKQIEDAPVREAIVALIDAGPGTHFSGDIMISSTPTGTAGSLSATGTFFIPKEESKP